jgi:hypothetical protein
MAMALHRERHFVADPFTLSLVTWAVTGIVVATACALNHRWERGKEIR